MANRAGVVEPPKRTEVTVMMQVTLPQETVDAVVALSPNGEHHMEKISIMATTLLKQAASGAMMLSVHDSEALRKIGVTADRVRALVDRALSMDEGRTVVRVACDPAYERALVGIGVSRGRTVSELMQDIVSRIIQEGSWFNGLAPAERIINLSTEDAAAVKEFLGDREFTGHDILEKMREMQGELSPLMA